MRMHSAAPLLLHMIRFFILLSAFSLSFLHSRTLSILWIMDSFLSIAVACVCARVANGTKTQYQMRWRWKWNVYWMSVSLRGDRSFVLPMKVLLWNRACTQPSVCRQCGFWFVSMVSHIIPLKTVVPIFFASILPQYYFQCLFFSRYPMWCQYGCNICNNRYTFSSMKLKSIVFALGEIKPT